VNVGDSTEPAAHEREQDLVKEYLPRVRSIVRRLTPRLPHSVDRDDLFQAGTLALIGAARRFDAERGAHFEAYAAVRVRGAVLDELRALDCVPRTVRRSERALERGRRAVEQREGRAAEADEIAEELGLSRERLEEIRARLRLLLQQPTDVLMDEEEGVTPGDSPWREYGPDPWLALASRRERDAVAAAITALPQVERNILGLLYWEEVSLEAAATALGLDAGRVRSLQTRALLRLRHRLRSIWE
jgi:RNA polymerase sigma factor for flagellar operon FliA